MNFEEIYDSLEDFEEEIKWAFDILIDMVKEYHPDINSNDEFQQIKEFYDQLFG